MPKHTCMMCRAAVCYCRARVPADLVPTIGKREIQRTLKTSKHSEAIVRPSDIRSAETRYPAKLTLPSGTEGPNDC